MRLISKTRLPMIAAAFAASSTFAFAHPNQPHEPLITPENWIIRWSFEPGIVIPLLIAVVLYAVGAYEVRRRSPNSPAVSGWNVICFALGWISLVIALNSPLHKLGTVLFSAHMAQHEVLMLISAPLLALGKPLIAFLFALPEPMRQFVATFVRRPAVKASWSSITGPLAVWIIHGSTLWAWHLPYLYEATLRSEFVHALQHTTFLGTALLFWWTLVNGRYGVIGYGIAFLYVFTTALHTSILGALLTFASSIWYPIYDGRTAPWSLTAIEDQQLGGLIMWVPSGVVFVVIGLALVAAWVGASERRAQLGSVAALAGTGGPDEE